MLVSTAKGTSDERRQADPVKQHEGYTGLKAPFGVQAVDESIEHNNEIGGMSALSRITLFDIGDVSPGFTTGVRGGAAAMFGGDFGSRIHGRFNTGPGEQTRPNPGPRQSTEALHAARGRPYSWLQQHTAAEGLGSHKRAHRPKLTGGPALLHSQNVAEASSALSDGSPATRNAKKLGSTTPSHCPRTALGSSDP
ncbi:hypothetical protein PANT_7c00008 [Moesziomyces antarcticus T-34]|uniref:Uncharacterized protein n=1 Tax=Pseudozyma antarctica (strain T-34) TaxID=1151754 RepID=M9MD30_PSEA3|nr:hypothetical protein PANT_7c00008 [Moesziomyces antarcticus T-34]